MKRLRLSAGVPRPRSGSGGAAAGGEGGGPGGRGGEDPPGPGCPPGPRRVCSHPPQPGSVAAHHWHPVRTQPSPPGRWVQFQAHDSLFLFLCHVNIWFQHVSARCGQKYVDTWSQAVVDGLDLLMQQHTVNSVNVLSGKSHHSVLMYLHCGLMGYLCDTSCESQHSDWRFKYYFATLLHGSRCKCSHCVFLITWTYRSAAKWQTERLPESAVTCEASGVQSITARLFTWVTSAHTCVWKQVICCKYLFVSSTLLTLLLLGLCFLFLHSLHWWRRSPPHLIKPTINKHLCHFVFLLLLLPHPLRPPPVMNGHTTCVRLLLDESDSADLVDAADSQGQWVLCVFLPFSFLLICSSLFLTPPLPRLQDSSDAGGRRRSCGRRVTAAGAGSKRERCE